MTAAQTQTLAAAAPAIKLMVQRYKSSVPNQFRDDLQAEGTLGAVEHLAIHPDATVADAVIAARVAVRRFVRTEGTRSVRELLVFDAPHDDGEEVDE
jgi:hypothetical protein